MTSLIVKSFFAFRRQSNSVYDASFVSNPVVFAFSSSKFGTADTACGGESGEVVDGSTGNALLDGLIKDYNKIAG